MTTSEFIGWIIIVANQEYRMRVDSRPDSETNIRASPAFFALFRQLYPDFGYASTW